MLTLTRGSSTSTLPRSTVESSTPLSRLSSLREGSQGTGRPPGIRRGSSFEVDITFTGVKRPWWVESVWMFLADPECSTAARLYKECMNPFIVASIFVILLQTTDPPARIRGAQAAILEVVFDFVFSIDILLRFAFCPDRSVFMKSKFNLIDMTAVPSLCARSAMGFVLPEKGTVDNDLWLFYQVFFLGAMPIFRLLKLLRRFNKCLLVFRALRDACEVLPVLIYMLALLVVTGASFIFFLEPESFDNLPTCMWFAMVTMTTVGYGDIYPVTAWGRVATMVLIVVAMLYTAIPIGIIGHSFSQVWEDRQRYLIAQRTHHRLLQWGYGAMDMPRLFKMFDHRRNGELNFKEFKRMMMQMKIGLKVEDIGELFDAFDRDGSGAVDDKEFVREIFPADYHKLYSSDDEEEPETVSAERDSGDSKSAEDIMDNTSESAAASGEPNGRGFWRQRSLPVS